MTFRQSLGLNLAPLVMRLTLGVVFLWAGSAKLFNVDTFPPEQAAVLANIGAVAPPASFAPPEEAIPDDAPDPSEIEEQVPIERDPDVEDPASADPGVATSQAPFGARVVLAQNGGVAYTALDYPEGVEARRLYSLALLMNARAYPAEGPALWPPALASDTMLSVMAWAAAVTELGAGVFLLVGLMTRLAALSLFGTMITAMVLTSIGPAWAGGDAFLGFLPDPQFDDPGAWVGAWQSMLFQLTTGALALSVFLTGAGWLSLDRAVFGKRSSGASEES